MANFFDWLNRAFEDESPKGRTKQMYTIADVQADMAAAMIVLLSEFQEIPEKMSVPAAISKDAVLLSEFGFSNARNAAQIQPMVNKVEANNAEHQEKTQKLLFMERAWEIFGRDAMVVRYDQFFEILEKYDMVCGSFDRYTGTVPSEVLAILPKLKGILHEGAFPEEYRLMFKSVCSFGFDIEKTSMQELFRLARVPFGIGDKQIDSAIAKFTGHKYTYHDDYASHSDALFIAAPAADMKPLKMEICFHNTQSIGDKALRKAEGFDSDLRNYKFLYADKRARIQKDAIREAEQKVEKILIKEGLGRYLDCTFIKSKPIPERVVYDPFICSLTPYGVLIHAKWGAEAEDATIKRYEQLRDAIIGKGGAV